ncbi:NADP:D-xylose dehydrogenase [Sodiomyces alkalinus F11]|uniref:D-xylose 1-dehydrogenase (NADP(+), D-xylono-1,5-lactone-forming) n=1 Tax=Sodiomyces alkalinus (strain CBS 110278 / VKM F-3762 / F11) TaxID=1314773 RepID=A0A3N2Q0J1_SODAK|nr:NADP:D-xylose dehydrogenase [Sodiomyces alkalinus F11]ROT40281.1 NADP:D-xylose dehydrogenase [Sodiomyces alkalinus F11]
MATESFTLRWGILATGFIAEMFTRDLLTNTASREVTDVTHKLVAVASSKEAQKASDFIKKVDGPAEAKAYGSYAELVNDPDVDIIYVATPHSHHFQNTMLALHAGKHVLCEKALTVTADQARRLVETAREKNLFLMEAVWTRHQPLSKKVRELVAAGEIGPVSRVFADISFNNLAGEDGKLYHADSSRSVNLDLAGGALLDLGVYALTWVFQVLYHIQPEADKEKPEVVAALNKYHTGSDDSTAIILRFPKHNTLAVATTSMRTATDPSDKGLVPAVRIQGAKGEIQVGNPAFRPDDYRIIRKDGGGEVETVKYSPPVDDARGGWGQGFYWQADEAARCIRDGKIESSVMPLDESIAIMEVVDAALQQGGVAYPDHITSTEYDPQNPLNTGKA